ncbi:bacillithiol system redox-active protein YtxJ [Bacillus stratosphericus]|uniref:bacillithiol system redox-active protein YtxJ n=1 Tax=Bacillus stratosphericus TaxID=293386 RepID=UPI001CF931D3|nr:bacillithiol system redox-active protein YtxJ [Bacillus stratosphericus]
MSKQLIETEEQFDQLMNQDGTFVFFKHSLTCPISKAAFKEFEAFACAHGDVPTYFLEIQNTRELSAYVAEKTGVKHESPQALVFSGGKIKWHVSHSSITKEALEYNM